ncbi:Glucose-6-phosphate 1-dehydrogenase [Buchnera aphidicola (Thelaxes suberi)]|uniref:glucose-6-phosphate dehydrogenase n=1 Tax=Buchnera aphidicola TaxID=9 RepID=UPI003464034F
MKIKKSVTCCLIIFGAKGDLTRRKLLPALYNLEKIGQLNKNFRIISVGRASWNNQDYLKIVKKSLVNFLNSEIDINIWKKLKIRFNFCNLDVNKIYDFVNLKTFLTNSDELIINYFATPSSLFESICRGLAYISLNSDNSKIVIEKPIGNSLITSKLINNNIGKYFKEHQIFRIDHYLGKETILNLLSLRFANSIFCNIWNKNYIDNIQITLSEEVGIEGRWNYFNQTGQIRDMIQNHLLQILTIITMENPNNLESNSIRNEKIKILKSLRFLNKKNINNNIILGQYGTGLLKGKKIPAYREEDVSISSSNIETFAAMKIFIDNESWKNVPFYIRTGKRLNKKYSKIVIVFKKSINHLNFDDFHHVINNKLIIHLEPNEGWDLEIFNKIPNIGSQYELKRCKLSLSYNHEFSNYNIIDAYTRLLSECIQDNQSLFVCRDEIEQSWKWIDTIINLCKEQNVPIHQYQPGSYGPIESKNLLLQDNRNWI